MGVKPRGIISAMVDSRYRRNAGVVFNLKYHLLWCPKYRQPILDGEVKHRLQELLREKASEVTVRKYIEAQERRHG